MSASLATHWVANLAIGQLFLPALGAFGVSAVYLFFAAVCAATVAFTGSQVVETKARAHVLGVPGSLGSAALLGTLGS